MAHANFDLYKRKPTNPNRKTFIYYRSYDSYGNRLPGKSTGIEFRGERSWARARAYCEELYKNNLLHCAPDVLFETFARGWFLWDSCPYVLDRRANGTSKKAGITETYVSQMRGYLDNHILPYFGSIPLIKINPVKIRSWRLWLRAGRVDASGKVIPGLSNKTINNVASCLKIMMDWAQNDDLIPKDPFRGIDQFVVDDDVRGAFTIDQVKAIISAKWNCETARLFAFTAAVTGMREAEVRAIRRESLHPDYIDVDLQFKREGLAPLKTKDKRKVPICSEVYDILDALIGTRRFAFDNGTGDPFGVNYLVSKRFKPILETLFPEEMKNKGLVFHSFRHFYNTYLLSENVPREKVDAVIGHSSGKGSMSELYTHWSQEMMPEVYEAQEKLICMLMK